MQARPQGRPGQERREQSPSLLLPLHTPACAELTSPRSPSPLVEMCFQRFKKKLKENRDHLKTLKYLHLIFVNIKKSELISYDLFVQHPKKRKTKKSRKNDIFYFTITNLTALLDASVILMNRWTEATSYIYVTLVY